MLGEDPGFRPMRALGREAKGCALVEALLRNPREDVYAKWQGAYWVLAALADPGYPAGDGFLRPLAEAVLSAWLAPRYFREFAASKKAEACRREAIPVTQGRHRTCASQQGNALFILIRLGLGDGRIHDLAERLLHWQWPDGGWNCDKDPSAAKSSFIHTALTLRGLAACRERHPKGRPGLSQAIDRAAEVLLSRRLFRRLSDGEPVKAEFTALHYPLYWHYDILGALKIMGEAGYLGDKRCAEAPDLLESKRLPGGGWPAEARYYKVSTKQGPGHDTVDWGGTGRKLADEWVTADAMAVLRRANRFIA